MFTTVLMYVHSNHLVFFTTYMRGLYNPDKEELRSEARNQA